MREFLETIGLVLLALVISVHLTGCGTIRVNRKGCKPVISSAEVDFEKMIQDPENEWVCSQSIWSK